MSGEDCPLIAERDGEAVGLAWARTEPAEPSAVNLFQMWVAPSHRRHGIGAKLLDAAITWARARGVRCVQLGVTCGDTAALRLYARHGFKPFGPVEALRPDSELACQPMRLMLNECESEP